MRTQVKVARDKMPCPAEVAAKGAWEALRYRMKQYGLQGVLRHYGAWRYAVSLVPAYGVATGQHDLGHELGFAQLSPGTSTPSRPSLSRAHGPSYGVARAANIGGAPQLAGLGLLTGVVSAEVLKWMSSIKRDLRRRWHESGTLTRYLAPGAKDLPWGSSRLLLLSARAVPGRERHEGGVELVGSAQMGAGGAARAAGDPGAVQDHRPGTTALPRLQVRRRGHADDRGPAEARGRARPKCAGIRLGGVGVGANAPGSRQATAR